MSQSSDELRFFEQLTGYQETSNYETSEQFLENYERTTEAISTKQPLWSNPWSKLILVSVGTGSAALIAALFLASITNGGARNVKNSNSQELRSPTPATPSTQPDRTDIADQQTKLALQTQVQDIEAASNELKKPEPQINKSDSKPAPVAPKIPTPTPVLATSPLPLAPSKPVVPPPPKIIVREVVRQVRVPVPAPTRITPSTPIPRPLTAVNPTFSPIARPPAPIVTLPHKIAPPSTPNTATTKPAPTTTNSMEQWTALSQLGSYGHIEPNSDSNNQNATVANLPLNDKPAVTPPELTVAEVPKAILVDRTKTVTPEPEKNSVEQRTTEVYLAEENYILRETPLNEEARNFQVGQHAKASLVTPIVSSDISNLPTANQNQERFVVKLNQPLRDNAGQTLLPSETLVIFVVSGVNPNGLVMGNAIAVVVDGKEYQLPPGVISLRGDNGKPLIASKWGGSGSTRIDATTTVLGAVAKIGQVINQPRREQQEEIGDIYNSRRRTTIERGEPNLLGAALEGGLNPLQQQIQQRNQRAAQESQNRPNLWYVQEGKKVQVFVNRSFDM
ncbi:TrbI/VirB10 family protein [Aerosakkonemataceae cyanobacterium BLCC-F50]|uniref:TrbI/VirB10 family protein n=1 Tax=Floridaenema flaviceps BLCC-F50 TaxID=3153642 RepID=A0ABV4XKS9_9CYAN